MARGLGESLDRKHLWGPGGAANERKFQKSPRDKLFMSVNFIYVDWDLLQLSVFSYTHRSCLPNILQKNSFVKPCLQMPSCTCFPAARWEQRHKIAQPWEQCFQQRGLRNTYIKAPGDPA